MRMRVLATLATVAALLGAPSIASGAENSLVSPSVSPTTGTVATSGFVNDPVLGVVLLIGLSGVVAVAIIGTALPVIARRRSEEHKTPTTGTSPRDTEAVLERRTVRRAKVRLTDDPIVAAMGVDDHVAARRRRSATGQTAGGPAERPVRRRR